MKVAYFLRSLDLIFSRENSYEIFAICPENSEEMRIAQEELHLTNIIPLKLKRGVLFSELRPEAIFKNSDLAQQLKKYGIHCLFLRNSTKYLKEWSGKNNVIILSPAYQLAEKFEDKLYFDNFLKRTGSPAAKSVVLRSKNSHLPFVKTVIQIPKSTGGEGTFFADSEQSFQEIVQNLKLPLLAREYKKGVSLGVSFFVDEKDICLSALNRQCFLEDEKRAPLGPFIGIQWLPAQTFSLELYSKINQALIKIAEKLRKEGLLGMFNLDFILSETGDLFFLECNPRITAATPQIIARNELNGGVDFMRLLLNYFGRKNYPAKRSDVLPPNTFQGAQMSVDWPAQKIKKVIPGGFFVLEGNKLKKIELQNQLDFLNLKKGLFFYQETNKGEDYKKAITAGTVFSNFPMYSFKTGFLNQSGKIVYKFFH